MSALNIPDVPAILEHHGLVCVPVDLDIGVRLCLRLCLLRLHMRAATASVVETQNACHKSTFVSWNRNKNLEKPATTLNVALPELVRVSQDSRMCIHACE